MSYIQDNRGGLRNSNHVSRLVWEEPNKLLKKLQHPKNGGFYDHSEYPLNRTKLA